MAPSDVDKLLNAWETGYERGFRYLDHGLLDIEWLVIVKRHNDLYEVFDHRSSTKAGPFNREAMEKLLGADKLELQSTLWGIDYKYKKSNGCTCGMWRTSEPNCHSWWCDKVNWKK